MKSVLASVTLALAGYQLILAAIGYRKLPVIEAQPAFLTRRASGDVIAVLLALVALACLAVFGVEDDYMLHGAAWIMQLFGSIAVALAIVAITIALVTANLGPNAEDDGGGHGGDRQEQKSGTGRGEDR